MSALVVSLVALLVAPGIAASRARGSADVALQSLTRRAEPAIAAEAEARRLSIALEQIARFSASRRPMLLLLGRVSTALPDSTAVVSLRVDSTGGNMIVMSPVGVMPLAEIDSIAGLKGAQIVGAVTRESVGGVELQRQAIRFTLARGRRSVPREGAP